MVEYAQERQTDPLPDPAILWFNVSGRSFDRNVWGSDGKHGDKGVRLVNAAGSTDAVARATHQGERYDVIVVGAGNAALCAAISAREEGASVLVLEAADPESRGGNSFFTGGALRFAFNDLEDIRRLIPDLTDEEAEQFVIAPMPAEKLFDELAELSEYLADPELTDAVVDNGYDALKWLSGHGVKFGLAAGRHGQRLNGKIYMSDGNPVELWGGGRELVGSLFRISERLGAEIRYDARAVGLDLTDDGVEVAYLNGGTKRSVRASAVILASGGFEANPEMRARYLGPNWELARVRGTEYNVGDGLRMALDLGAASTGHWSGCHAVAWDVNAPLTGDRKIGDSFQKHSYPHGIVVNALAERFVDEGADFHTRTYAKYGGEILKQPGRVAYQIFDEKVMDRLREEYRQRATKYTADTIVDLAKKMGVDPDQLEKTVNEFNGSINDNDYNPTMKDGKSTVGVTPPKSNWALPIDKPPFVAYAVTCGITFSYGGVRTSTDAEIVDPAGRPLPGLYAAGEIVGGLYFYNYPSGAGLISGAVFGRAAGRSAAKRAAER